MFISEPVVDMFPVLVLQTYTNQVANLKDMDAQAGLCLCWDRYWLMVIIPREAKLFVSLGITCSWVIVIEIIGDIQGRSPDVVKLISI